MTFSNSMRIVFGVTLFLIVSLRPCTANEQPNFVLLMCDDLGYGDTGFNGNRIIRTPHLDEMARSGAVLTNFHAGAPVCSPTRGSCLTGRHPWRYGIWFANRGHLPRQEITLAGMLKSKGYETGHFGKWHLGTLNKKVSAKGPGRKPALNFSPPWERDYDTSFVTESAVATWNPAEHKRYINNPYYENGVVATDNLAGDDSRVIMDRAIPFVENSVRNKSPFLAVIWFHTPHLPVIAGPEYLAMYEGHGQAAHYYGCITAMDEQVGRLRKRLRELEVIDNTLLFFCSDNGPEGKQVAGLNAGTTSGLRGRKRSLYEGGVRVPAIVEFPGHVKAGTEIDVPLSTLDYFPTIQNIVGYEMPDDRPLDGVDLLPIVKGEITTRPPIVFRTGKQAAVLDHHFKALFSDYNGPAELYDLAADSAEQKNIANDHADVVKRLRQVFRKFETTAKQSHAGSDYTDQFTPVDPWQPLEE